MEQEMSPLAQIRYRITLEQYLDFNRSIAEQNFKKQRRKSVLMGGVEMVVGALFLVSLLALEPQKQQQMPYFSLYLVLGFILILLGVYSVAFYKVIFPGSWGNPPPNSTRRASIFGEKFLWRSMRIIFLRSRVPIPIR